MRVHRWKATTRWALHWLPPTAAKKATKIVTLIRAAGVLLAEETNGALTDAALMGMNNLSGIRTWKWLITRT
ncbi:MAG: Alkylhydroperoxidase protein D [uncultured Caballeronia sp.]|nr:MAG: Alkylhydroperoxidase protein D [uncultured Caballeronia sp.]